MALLYAVLHRNIQDVFNEYGVQIMTLAYKADPAVPKIVPQGSVVSTGCSEGGLANHRAQLIFVK